MAGPAEVMGQAMAVMAREVDLLRALVRELHELVPASPAELILNQPGDLAGHYRQELIEAFDRALVRPG